MLEQIATTPVMDIQLREPVRVAPDARLIDVVAQIRELRRGGAIIEDRDGQLVGIFTERDLMLRVDHGSHAWHDAPVSDVMSTSPVTVPSSAPLAHALELMSDGGFRHLPVVDNDGRTAGLLSIRDILAHIVEYFPEEFINLPPDPDREASSRWGG